MLMRAYKFLSAVLIGGLLAFPVDAAKVAGVELDETARLSARGLQVALNGAGIRKKFVFEVYVGALYLQKKLTTVDAILNDTGAKRVLMHFLHKKVRREKLVNGWIDGFNKNSKTDIGKLQRRLDDFNKLFTDVKKGDVILLDYLPGKGTRVTINGSAKGAIPGADFNKALLKVWLGPKPADAKLKKAMLGG